MKKDVVSLLYSLAGKVKTIRDRDNAYSEVHPTLSPSSSLSV
jgi:hypothetical protein